MGAVGTRFGPGGGLFDTASSLRGNAQHCLSKEAVLSASKKAFNNGAKAYYHSEQGILNNMRDDLRYCVEGDSAQSYFFNNFNEILQRGCFAGDPHPVFNVHILTQRSPCSVCSTTWLGAVHNQAFLRDKIQACLGKAWTSEREAGVQMCGGAAPEIRLTVSFESNELYVKEAPEHISAWGFSQYFTGNPSAQEKLQNAGAMGEGICEPAAGAVSLPDFSQDPILRRTLRYVVSPDLKKACKMEAFNEEVYQLTAPCFIE
ncbi:MAG: hypothetical protein Q8Q56_01170 [Alphaproteobacteria bacterium]|nr:hypothetical protein [Alphaproteobacteria bacterium]